MADHLSRKLAVILHADVVGSTQLVQRNEMVAHERIRSSFRCLSETIETYGGFAREIRGDALVAEFARASDAVTASLAFQARNSDANTRFGDDITPEIRIGISLGEVIVADDTITGAGIVLAQRLEQLAEPGGVVTQGSVTETVPTRLPFEFRSLGEQTLKGFDQPVRAFAVRLQPGEELPESESERSPAPIVPIDDSQRPPPLDLPDKPSIVVLPFTNMSSDPEQEYFSDGVSEDIITDLSKFSGLFVIARNSAFTYKGKAVSVPDVCRELGVRFALEGSIRKAGNRIRVNAQLIDGMSGGHVWAERFDRELADIFAVQDDVTREIVTALAPRLIEEEPKSPKREPTQNLEAYDWFLRGRERWWQLDRVGNRDAQSMFEKAVALDPNFAMAWAWLAASHLVDAVNGWGQSAEESARMHSELVHKAAQIDNSDAFTHVQLGMAHIWAHEHEFAIAEGRKAIEIDPNFAHAHFDLAWFLVFAGRSLEALAELDHAHRLDPHFSDLILHVRALAHFQMRRYEEAIACLRRRLTRNPNTDVSNVLLASCYGHLGQPADGQAAWRRAMDANPGYSLEHKRKTLPYKDPAEFQHFIGGLRKAGIEGIDAT